MFSKYDWDTETICSLSMIGIMKQYHEEEVIRLDREVQSILGKIGGHFESSIYKKEKAKLKKNLERFIQHIIRNKDTKFTMNKVPFKTG